MEYGGYFHYHFAGSKKEFLNLSPNNLLLWEGIKLGRNLGCKRMHLGGGREDSEDDNLLRFKGRYSSERNDFYIGKRIHNKEVYDRLIGEWEAANHARASRVLQYKY